MNPFRKIANSLMNWWKGETAPEVSDSTELTGGVMTLNSPSFLESMGLSRRRKTTSEVTYFTCLKMLSETLAKMPIKYYQRTDKGIIEAEQTEPVHDTDGILEHSGNQPQSLRERLCVHEKEIHPEEIRRRGQNS